MFDYFIIVDVIIIDVIIYLFNLLSIIVCLSPINKYPPIFNWVAPDSVSQALLPRQYQDYKLW